MTAWFEETRALLADLSLTFEASPVAARATLRSLLTTPITVTPEVEDGVLRFHFSGSCRYATLDRVLLVTRGEWALMTTTEDLDGQITRSREPAPAGAVSKDGAPGVVRSVLLTR